MLNELREVFMILVWSTLITLSMSSISISSIIATKQFFFHNVGFLQQGQDRAVSHYTNIYMYSTFAQMFIYVLRWCISPKQSSHSTLFSLVRTTIFTSHQIAQLLDLELHAFVQYSSTPLLCHSNCGGALCMQKTTGYEPTVSDPSRLLRYSASWLLLLLLILLQDFPFLRHYFKISCGILALIWEFSGGTFAFIMDLSQNSQILSKFKSHFKWFLILRPCLLYLRF